MHMLVDKFVTTGRLTNEKKNKIGCLSKSNIADIEWNEFHGESDEIKNTETDIKHRHSKKGGVSRPKNA